MYERTKVSLNIIDSLINVYDLSAYVVDCEKKSFIYVSSNALFLSGYDREKVINIGYEFYSYIIEKQELEWFYQVNQSAQIFFIIYQCINVVNLF